MRHYIFNYIYTSGVKLAIDFTAENDIEAWERAGKRASNLVSAGDFGRLERVVKVIESNKLLAEEEVERLIEDCISREKSED